MIATTDIVQVIPWAFRMITKLANALHMTPFTLIVIIVVVFSILHSIAERSNARRDMEEAIRKSKTPPPLP
jgi:uncharacterized Rmd1/YagE family protein